jgi:polyhydroxybutyrate depolymerase
MMRRGLLPFFASLLVVAFLPACGLRGASAGRVATVPASGTRPALARQAGMTAHSLTVDGRERTYALHLPPAVTTGTALPLVLVFHGGGGEGKQMPTLTGMNSIADREGFVAAYPDGIDRNWNDGRFSQAITTQRFNLDDVGFVSALIDELATTLPIDRSRVFATGISNGGMFSQRLGCDLADKVAAIAPVAGSLPELLAPGCAPARPMPVLMIHGDADPLVPWNGGPVAGDGNRGRVLSVADTVSRWVALDGCAATPTIIPLPDRAPNDGTTTSDEVYSSCRAGAQVELYAVANGGHTWPGGFQYLPERIIGKTSRDFDASETIWSFFAHHPRP